MKIWRWLISRFLGEFDEVRDLRIAVRELTAKKRSLEASLDASRDRANGLARQVDNFQASAEKVSELKAQIAKERRDSSAALQKERDFMYKDIRGRESNLVAREFAFNERARLLKEYLSLGMVPGKTAAGFDEAIKGETRCQQLS